eukprot:758671-Hanusia_phi.AAC.3
MEGPREQNEHRELFRLNKSAESTVGVGRLQWRPSAAPVARARASVPGASLPESDRGRGGPVRTQWCEAAFSQVLNRLSTSS